MSTDLSIIALPVEGDAWKLGEDPLVELLSKPFGQCARPAPEAAKTHIGRWRTNHLSDRGVDPSRCARAARYRLGVATVCKLHAGELLLDAAIALSFRKQRDDEV